MQTASKKNKIVVIIIVIFLISIFYYFNKVKSSIKEEANQNQIAEEKAEEATVENQETKRQPVSQEKRLEDVSQFDLAKEKNDFNICNEIEDIYTRDLCFKQIALDLSDSSGCAHIKSKQEQNMCNFIIYKRKALEDKKVDPCHKLKNQDLINRCVKQVVEANFCLTEKCLYDFLKNKENYDSDKDGLTDNEEVYIYRTDPNNPDTDGDGYPDGNETESGYDPKGDGD